MPDSAIPSRIARQIELQSLIVRTGPMGGIARRVGKKDVHLDRAGHLENLASRIDDHFKIAANLPLMIKPKGSQIDDKDRRSVAETHLASPASWEIRFAQMIQVWTQLRSQFVRIGQIGRSEWKNTHGIRFSGREAGKN